MVSRNNREKSIILPDVSSLALLQWNTMSVEISPTFLHAMDLELNLILQSVHAGPKGNRSRNLGRAVDCYRV